MGKILLIIDQISKRSYNCISSSVLGPKESVATPAVIAVITSGRPEEKSTKGKPVNRRNGFFFRYNIT